MTAESSAYLDLVGQLRKQLDTLHTSQTNSHTTSQTTNQIWGLLACLKRANFEASLSLDSQRAHSLNDRSVIDRLIIEHNTWLYERECLIGQIQGLSNYQSINQDAINTVLTQLTEQANNQSISLSENDSTGRKNRIDFLNRELIDRTNLTEHVKTLQDDEQSITQSINQTISLLDTMRTQLEALTKSLNNQSINQTINLSEMMEPNQSINQPFDEERVLSLPSPLYTIYQSISSHQRVFNEQMHLTINQSNNQSSNQSISFVISQPNNQSVAVKLTIIYDADWRDVSLRHDLIDQSNNQIIKDLHIQALFPSFWLSSLYPGDDQSINQSINQSNLSSISPTVAIAINQSIKQSNNQSNNQKYVWLQRICGINQLTDQSIDQSIKQTISLSDVIYRIRNRLIDRLVLIDQVKRFEFTHYSFNQSNNQSSNQSNNFIKTSPTTTIWFSRSINQSINLFVGIPIDFPSHIPSIHFQSINQSNNQSINQFETEANTVNMTAINQPANQVLIKQMEIVQSMMQG